MQEFDENNAIAQMCEVLTPEHRDEDAVCEVLDLIFDFYEENGDLDIDFDDDNDADDAADIAAMVTYISKALKRNPADITFSDDEIEAMVKAEIAYEESLI